MNLSAYIILILITSIIINIDYVLADPLINMLNIEFYCFSISWHASALVVKTKKKKERISIPLRIF